MQKEKKVLRLNKLINKIILIVKGTTFLYTLILKLRGRYDPQLFPSKKTDIHVTGYPRSGNTFALYLLKQLLPNLNIATHIHATSSIKSALHHNVPVIVLLRDPEECIPSAIIKRKSSSLRRDLFAIQEYNLYYKYVEKNLNRICVLEFSQIVNNWRIFIDTVCDITGNKKLSSREISNAVETVMKKLKADKRPPAQNTWASPQKQTMKLEVLKRIVDLQEFTKAQNLFNRLKSMH
ncbi:MAG: hypothetical protein ACOC80_10615 [Petrotogales bacterium]